MSVQKGNPHKGPLVMGGGRAWWLQVDGPGTYAVLPWEDWVEVLAWAEDDQGLPHDLRQRLGLAIIEGADTE